MCRCSQNADLSFLSVGSRQDADHPGFELRTDPVAVQVGCGGADKLAFPEVADILTRHLLCIPHGRQAALASRCACPSSGVIDFSTPTFTQTICKSKASMIHTVRSFSLVLLGSLVSLKIIPFLSGMSLRDALRGFCLLRLDISRIIPYFCKL